MSEPSELFADDDGSTPLDPDELDDLLPPHIGNRSELNQWEAVNISEAREWLHRLKNPGVLSVDWLAELHRRMFDKTWKWAGKFRRSDKNISPYSWTEVPMLMRDLVADTKHQCESSGVGRDALDLIALRFHHRLVLIHPWSNGNGRHARLATDVLLAQLGEPPFSWGSDDASLIASGTSRGLYLAAMRSADKGDLSQLEKFARS